MKQHKLHKFEILIMGNLLKNIFMFFFEVFLLARILTKTNFLGIKIRTKCEGWGGGPNLKIFKKKLYKNKLNVSPNFRFEGLYIS